MTTIIDKNIALETARLLFSIQAITLSPKKPYRYTSGIFSPIYWDNRVIISYPHVRNKIIDFYLHVIKKTAGNKNFKIISGTATAAIANAMLIADRLKKPMVYVEVTKKENAFAKIRGKVEKGDRAVIIEDLISTGGSAISNALTIRRVGGKVKNIIAITTYNMKKAQEAFKKNKVKLYTLTEINITLDAAEKYGYLKKGERGIVEEWLKDPPSWGKKMGYEK